MKRQTTGVYEISQVGNSAERAVPHSGQNLAPASNEAPHWEQTKASLVVFFFTELSGCPHSMQNFECPLIAAPHSGHFRLFTAASNLPMTKSVNWSMFL